MKTRLYDITISPYVEHFLGRSKVFELLNRHHLGDYGVNGDYDSNCIQLINAILDDDDDYTLPGIRNVIALHNSDSDSDSDFDNLYDSVFSAYIVGNEEIWIVTNLKRKFTLVAFANCI